MYPKRCTWSLKIVLRLSSGKSIGITAKLKSYEHLKYVWNAFGVLNQSHERSGQDEKPQNPQNNQHYCIQFRYLMLIDLL